MSNHARNRNNGRHPATFRKDGSVDLSAVASEAARRDTCALLIGMMFYKTVGSQELMEETMIHLREDPERMQGVIGSLLSFLYQYVTASGQYPQKWKDLTDYLASTVNVETPPNLP